MNQRILSDDAFRSCTHTDNHIMLRGKNRDIQFVDNIRVTSTYSNCHGFFKCAQL